MHRPLRVLHLAGNRLTALARHPTKAGTAGGLLRARSKAGTVPHKAGPAAIAGSSIGDRSLSNNKDGAVHPKVGTAEEEVMVVGMEEEEEGGKARPSNSNGDHHHNRVTSNRLRSRHLPVVVDLESELRCWPVERVWLEVRC